MLNSKIVFDYGEEGRIIATEPEAEQYEVHAKAKAKDGGGNDIVCTGGSFADEGPPIGSCTW